MKKTFAVLTLLMTVCYINAFSQTVSGNYGGHNFVDLGLPSGIKWATCNVGANIPTECGNYYAWGETKQKDFYSWATYKWCNGSRRTLTKYCTDKKHGTVDNKTQLEPEDDAATVNWGNKWRMPSKENVEELLKNCRWVWTNNYNGTGVAGRIGTSKKNGNTIFLPATGYRRNTGVYYTGECGYYCSSTAYENTSNIAYNILLGNESIDWNVNNRFFGQSVRAVAK